MPSLTEYIRNKEARYLATFYFPKRVIVFEGLEYTQQEFEKAFPIDGKILNQTKADKGENAAKSARWNDGGKSY